MGKHVVKIISFLHTHYLEKNPAGAELETVLSTYYKVHLVLTTSIVHLSTISLIGIYMASKRKSQVCDKMGTFPIPISFLCNDISFP